MELGSVASGASPTTHLGSCLSAIGGCHLSHIFCGIRILSTSFVCFFLDVARIERHPRISLLPLHPREDHPLIHSTVINLSTWHVSGFVCECGYDLRSPMVFIHRHWYYLICADAAQRSFVSCPRYGADHSDLYSLDGFEREWCCASVTIRML